MKKISVLGCGWLGLPLAKALLANNFAVNGSTTSVNKLSVIENIGIQPFLISLHENEITGDFRTFIDGAATLIIDVPPKLRGIEKENFVAKIQNTIPFIENATVKNVLFVSATSVYADNNAVVNENTICKPETESGQQLLLAEQLLQTNKNFKTTILRFGGLIGADRHPIRFLAGRKNIENPEGVINLIHQDDCIAIILKIIDSNIWGETFNAVAPFHEKRMDYYTRKSIELDLDLPQFNHEKMSFGKTIDSKKLMDWLDFEFKEV